MEGKRWEEGPGTWPCQPATITQLESGGTAGAAVLLTHLSSCKEDGVGGPRPAKAHMTNGWGIWILNA